MNLINVLRAYFRKAPSDPAVEGWVKYSPKFEQNTKSSSRKKVLVQSVHDSYYVSVFLAVLSLISKKTSVDVERLVFQSVEMAIGARVSDVIKRSFLFNWLICRQWSVLYKNIAPKVAYRSVSLRHPILDSIALFRSISEWKKLKSLLDLERLEIQGVKCGDLVIDTYLRFRPAATVDLNDWFLCYVLWQARRDVFRARRYFLKSRPDLFLSSYSTYIQHGVPVRVALELGVKVVTFGNFQQLGKVLSAESFYHTKDSKNYKAEFEGRGDKDQLVKHARACLDSRLSGGVDYATSYMRSSAYEESGSICPDVSGAVIVYLHDFFDSPHVYPDMLFPDFWVWICFTIEVLNANGIRFLLKRHPNQVSLSEGVLDQLQRVYPDLEFVPDGITTRQLVDGGMVCVITVYGTISHEVAYLGVPSIACCGGNPHVSFDFCNTAKTIFEYETLLGKSNQLRLTDLDAAKMEVLEFYSMHNLDLDPKQIEARDRMIKIWSECIRSDRDGQKIAEMTFELSEHPGLKMFVDEIMA